MVLICLQAAHVASSTLIDWESLIAIEAFTACHMHGAADMHATFARGTQAILACDVEQLTPSISQGSATQRAAAQRVLRIAQVCLQYVDWQQQHIEAEMHQAQQAAVKAAASAVEVQNQVAEAKRALQKV